jgi:glycosyltransferase involved in cell wall biosynthesis
MSYGRVANELVWGLQSMGVYVNTLGLDTQNKLQKFRPHMGGFLLAIPGAYQNYGALAQGGVRIAVTMLETSRIPQSWVDVLNTCDAVIVPAAFCVEAFQASGVKVPIHVVSLGISDVFKAPKRRIYTKPFTVLIAGDRGIRKNWWDAVRGFVKAFGENPKFRLVIKSHAMPNTFTNPNFEVIEGNYTDEEMRDMYYRCHVMLFPSRGEGFGFPPREFAATGGVAIATNWSGTADQLPQWGIPLPVREMEKGYQEETHLASEHGEWAKPHVEDMAIALRRVARNYSQHAAWAYGDAADYVSRRYQWSTFASQCWSIYQHYVEARYDRHAS